MAGARAKVNDRHASFLRGLKHATAVRQHIAAVVGHAEHAYPGIKHLHGLRAGFHLADQIGGQGVAEFVHQRVPEVGRGVHHGLGGAVVPRRAAFHHVGSHGKRATSKANQGHAAAFQGLAGQADGFQHVPQIRGDVGAAKAGNVIGSAHRVVERWPLAGDEFQLQAHRLGREQDVGEKDSGIHAQDVYGLKGDFRSNVGAAGDFQQAVFRAHGLIFGHVAPGLTHEPHRRGVHGQAAAGAEEAREG